MLHLPRKGLASRGDRLDRAGAGLGGILLRSPEVVVREGRRDAQPLGVAEPLVLDPQLGVLGGLWVELLELFEAVLEHLDLARPVTGLLAQRGELCAGGLVLVVQPRVALERLGHGRPTELVEHRAVLVAVAQPPLVGLAVDRHEVLTDLGEHADRSGPATDVGPRATLGRHRTDQDQAVAHLGPGLGSAQRGRVGGRDLDEALHHGGGGTSTHQARVGAGTEEQPQAGDDHGLAGAGLTSEHVEPGVQVEHGVVDDTESLDPQFLQHGATLSRDRDAAARAGGLEVTRVSTCCARCGPPPRAGPDRASHGC